MPDAALLLAVGLSVLLLAAVTAITLAGLVTVVARLIMSTKNLDR